MTFIMCTVIRVPEFVQPRCAHLHVLVSTHVDQGALTTSYLAPAIAFYLRNPSGA
jgi:hypothetical protein